MKENNLRKGKASAHTKNKLYVKKEKKKEEKFVDVTRSKANVTRSKANESEKLVSKLIVLKRSLG